MENSSSPSIVSNTILEAPDPGSLFGVYLELIFRTDIFLANYPEFWYETKVWFGSPSAVQLIIYK